MMGRILISIFLLGFAYVGSPAQETNWIETREGCKVYLPDRLVSDKVSWSGDCREGYANGVGNAVWFEKHQKIQTYSGEMVNGLPSGKGKFEHLLLNIKIDGKFQNGVPSGMVKYLEFTRKNDLKRYYEGRFLDGKPIGEGIEILFSEGDTSIYYKGDFQGWKWEGKAFLYREYVDGGRYDYSGDMRNNGWKGRGEISYYEGSRQIFYYSGEVDANQKNGHGEERRGDNLYVAEWENGVINGKGKIYFQDELVFEGQWLNGDFSGKCWKKFLDGSTYYGNFEQGEPSGLGIKTWKNGGHYIGQFKRGVFNGLGSISVNDQSRSGSWENGILRKESDKVSKQLEKIYKEDYTELLSKSDKVRN